MQIKIPISVGELFDKLSILEIKLQKISDKKKLANIQIEKNLLEQIIQDQKLIAPQELIQGLREVNARLWDIEDRIRILESKKEFGDEFIAVARSVYVQNDQRFEFKSKLNQHFGSLVQEEKSYEKY